jgi:hypothetical protein
MQKILLSIVLAATLNYATTANAKSISFTDPAKISIKNTIAETKFNQSLLTKYSHSNELDLSRVSVKDSDIPIIIEYLLNNPEITSLNLEGFNNLSSTALASLASVQTLTSLNLARHFKDCENNICSGGLEAKDAAAFAANTSLTSLNLAMNSIGDEGAIALSKNTHLKKLDVSSNDISDAGGLALARIKSLEELGLGNNENISSKTAIALSDNSGLRSLELQQTKIDDEGVIALVTHLPLVNLVLNDDNITDKSARAIADNKTITQLALAGTNMTATGAQILAADSHLTYLDFSGDFFGYPRPNDIGDIGAIALAHITTLNNLYLSSQQITRIGAIELGKSNINKLDLTANYDLGDAGAIGLAAKKSWEILEVSACSITDKGAEALAKSRFTILYALSNSISDTGVTALADKVQMILNISDNHIHNEGAFALARKGTMSILMVSNNYIGIIGVAELVNSRFDYLEIGQQYTSSLSDSGKKDSSYHEATTSLSKNRKFCYRDSKVMRCINKYAVNFSAHPSKV